MGLPCGVLRCCCHPRRCGLIRRQFHCLVNDFSLSAIKIGLIGNAEQASLISELIDQLPGIPVIADPVLAAGGGGAIANEPMIERLKSELLPRTMLITPNIPEARQLSGRVSADDCATSLLQSGCQNILITGTHEDGECVVNRLYNAAGKYSLDGPRLDHEYHGSGCTFASAISFYIASGHSLTNSMKLAQEFTFRSLFNADRPGKGQHFPVRNSKQWP